MLSDHERAVPNAAADGLLSHRRLTTPRMSSPRSRSIGALAILFAAAPFAFALIRAISTGYDVRYFWVALASCAGAVVVMIAVRRRTARAGVTLAIASLSTSTLLALLMGLLIGTRLGLGIIVVAAAFGFCSALGSWLFVMAWPKQTLSVK
jgi:hypothetical protein